MTSTINIHQSKVYKQKEQTISYNNFLKNTEQFFTSDQATPINEYIVTRIIITKML